MIITSHLAPTPYVVIDGLFDDYDYVKMCDEWVSLTEFGLSPERTGGAQTSAGVNVKNNSGVFLDEMYAANRSACATLTLNRRLFADDVMAELEQINPTFGLIRSSSIDRTLISYYGNDHHYGRHYDYNTITAMTYFLPQGDCFSGGVLRFTDHDIEFKPKNNQTILFLGCTYHEVTPLDGPDGVLRIAMSQFVGNWKWT